MRDGLLLERYLFVMNDNEDDDEIMIDMLSIE